MSIRSQFGTLALALTLGLTAACGAPATEENQGDRTQADGSYWGKLPNGPGLYIHNAKGALNQHGISTPDGWFYVTHFNSSGPDVLVHGGYIVGSTLDKKAGRVVSAERGGVSYKVKQLSAVGSELQLTLVDPITASTFTLVGGEIGEVTLHVQIPVLGKSRDTRQYSIFIKSVEKLDSVTGDVLGYYMYTQQDNMPGAPFVPYCNRNDLGGENEPAQFTPGSTWDMPTSVRNDDAAIVNVACASGAIDTCERWGYRPWSKAELASSSMSVSLREGHQACIYMKRADYCATGDTYTEDGTMIGIDDAYNPAFQKSGSSKREAIWGKSGALCLDMQRHPDMPISAACAATLPPCSAASYGSDWFVESQVM